MVNNPYKVGKTQWAKWNDAGREAFNEARDAGASYAEAIEAAAATTQQTEAARRAKNVSLFDKIAHAAEDVADVAATVSGVAAAAAPVVAVAKTVVKAATKGKKGK